MRHKIWWSSKSDCTLNYLFFTEKDENTTSWTAIFFPNRIVTAKVDEALADKANQVFNVAGCKYVELEVGSP